MANLLLILLAASWLAAAATGPPDKYVAEDYKRIICPFLSTIIHEVVLWPRNCFSKQALIDITIAAGVTAAAAREHVNLHFVNLPYDCLDIFDMEGLPCEHLVSTGVSDCKTSFKDCQSSKYEAHMMSCADTPDKDCGVPDTGKFDKLMKAVDSNGDSCWTAQEIREAFKRDKVPVIDMNPMATVSGESGFLLLLDAFAPHSAEHPGELCKQDLYTLLIERRFPSWYYFEARDQVPSVEHKASKADCFPGHALVLSADGQNTRIAKTALGMELLGAESHGVMQRQPILAFLHMSSGRGRTDNKYLNAWHQHGRLRASANHMVLISVDETTMRSLPVAAVMPGDVLLTLQDVEKPLVQSTVLAVSWETRQTGLFAPITASGTLIVDGALVSTYATTSEKRVRFEHCQLHASFFLLRLLHSVPSLTSLASLFRPGGLRMPSMRHREYEEQQVPGKMQQQRRPAERPWQAT
eukprot:TRINITY_DN46872_c0_g1_i2.p1 TRINITY_DN46872_c0_g1~~TRINITY_DN46872_c0_g1_i2.p1  ORF type:complete len:468 (-),score=77.74 TRINITY_DN46872_c0_g1_i2:227-1630(-)